MVKDVFFHHRRRIYQLVPVTTVAVEAATGREGAVRLSARAGTGRHGGQARPAAGPRNAAARREAAAAFLSTSADSDSQSHASWCSSRLRPHEPNQREAGQYKSGRYVPVS